jgi:hypothetical protein
MQKAWTKYHAAFLTNREQVTLVTKHPGVAAWISLKVFQMLVAEAYEKNTETVPDSVKGISEHEKSTVRYIAGSVVKKLKQRIFGLNKTLSRGEVMECLDQMIADSEVEGHGMTSLLTRGGLTQVQPSIADVFYIIEVMFRELAGSGSVYKQVNAKEFVTSCLGHPSITLCLDQCLSDHENAVKETVLTKVLELHF